MSQTIDVKGRREALQRVQVGAIGLLCVLLIVGLANIMIRNARTDDGPALTGAANVPSGASDANATAPNPNEPLADLGVTPTSESSSGGSVPDLKPDPRLEKRMDRDPEAAR